MSPGVSATGLGFDHFTSAANENARSRIYLGIHWPWDRDEGIKQGRKVADYVFTNAFTPIKKKDKRK